MSSPLFSVVIPTKNRSFIVADAIKSVLRQTCGDFEIVVSDNDDGESTRAVVAQFSDPRLRYVRSGGLTMPDNWDFAYAQSQGQYLLLLEDKSVLVHDCLERIASAVRAHKPHLVSWLQDIFIDTETPSRIYRPHRSREVRWIDCSTAIQTFLSSSRWAADQILPRGMNSCLSRELYAKILAGPTRRLCPPNSPDYTMAFVQLAFSDALLHIDDALTVYGSCRHSQGRKTLAKENTVQELARDFGPSQDYLSRVPLKVLLVTAALHNDYLVVREKLGGKLQPLSLNFANFFVECRHDIDQGFEFGGDMSEELEAWTAALAAQPADVRDEVAKRLQPKISLVRKIWRRSGLGALRKSVRGSTVVPLVAPPTFSSALEYVEWLAREPAESSPRKLA